MPTLLQRRLMMPKMDEEIAIYRHGALILKGQVIYVDNESISVRDEKLETYRVDLEELAKGMDDRSIVIKKKTQQLQ